MGKRVFTAAQQDALLSEISVACEQIAMLSAHACDCHGDADLVDALTSAMAALASRSGWFADLARTANQGSMHNANVVNDSVVWLLPERCRPVAIAETVEGVA